MLRAPPVVSMNLSVHSLRRAGSSFLFHQIHRRTRFEFDKASTPSGPKFWACGRYWRWRGPLIQLGNLNLDVHDRHRGSRGIGDIWPKGYSEYARKVRHRRRHHPTVIALHGITTKITKCSAGLCLCAKQSKEYYCGSPYPAASFHIDLPTQRAFESCFESCLENRWPLLNQRGLRLVLGGMRYVFVSAPPFAVVTLRGDRASGPACGHKPGAGVGVCWPRNGRTSYSGCRRSPY
jgi:hypothetical protein